MNSITYNLALETAAFFDLNAKLQQSGFMESVV
jgi:hypothetical protein